MPRLSLVLLLGGSLANAVAAQSHTDLPQRAARAFTAQQWAEAATSYAELARQTVTVSVTGGYAETQDLLENLEEMPRAYLVSSVTLSGGAEEGGFTTTITGDMFVMPPAQDPGPDLDLASSP